MGWPHQGRGREHGLTETSPSAIDCVAPELIRRGAVKTSMQAQARFCIVAAAAALAVLVAARAGGEEIAVGNYGIAANGMPFAVALEKKLYQAEGVNVTGIISSQGGGTSIRNMLAGGVAYGEANPGVTAVAIAQGADLKIVSDNVLTVAEFVWAVKRDSPIMGIKDFKGRKIGYTNPRSTSQALAILLLQAAGLKPEDATLIRTGGFGELDLGLIDVAPMAEPVSKYKGKYRAVAVASDILPPLDNVVGVTTAAAMASKGDFIRAVIRARRKAVESGSFSTRSPAKPRSSRRWRPCAIPRGSSPPTHSRCI